MTVQSYVYLIIALLLAPLFPGFILKTKAFFGGKQGPPLLIKYYTLAKLLRKGSVYSSSTTLLFRLGPVISLATAIMALVFLPLAGQPPVLSFEGDVILVLYLLGLGRFFTITAAMDTASPFEGMGAAREAYFPILCEGALFMVLILLFLLTGKLSLGAHFAGTTPLALWESAGAPVLFVIFALFIVMLTEGSRVPVDDPATHLELTMIHEVMVLDHSGPDLALIELGSFAKLLFYAALIAPLACPVQLAHPAATAGVFLAVLALIYVIIGVTESIMARLRMDRVPMFILTSFALAFFAAIISLEFVA
jgi:formate hydrogenlyase subunit 4